MNANAQNELLARRILYRVGHPWIGLIDAGILRRAELTLQRWSEQECNGQIERSGHDEKPYRVSLCNDKWRAPIPDREAGALKRVQEVCKRRGLYFYHQSDPRGCSLYVSTEPLDQFNYNNGIACCI